MIACEYDSRRALGRIVLRPNRSWPWRANLRLLATLLALTLGVAILLGLQGLWLVLPFAVLEMLVLGTCLYRCVRHTYSQEVLTLSPESVVLECGVNRPSMRMEFQRYFTRFFVLPPRHPWYGKQIALRCRGTDREIGSFLPAAEKETLVTELRTMIRRLEDHSIGSAASAHQ